MLRRLLLSTLVTALVSGAAVASEATGLVLDLRTASQLAAQRNPGLAGASASANVALATVAKAKSALYPTVSLRSDYGYVSKQTIFGTTPVLEHNTQTNRAELQQVIYSGGRVQAGISQAKHGYQAAANSAAASKAEVLTAVASGYFRARMAREAIAVAESSVQSLEASYHAAKKMRGEGLVTKSDVLRAEVALTSARAGVISARNSYAVSLATLRTAIGLPEDTVIDIADQPADADLAAIACLASAERPEVAASEAVLRASKDARKAAKAGGLPTAALVADFYNQPVGAQFPRLSNSLGAGVVLKFNVLDGGLTRASVAEADAAIVKAETDVRGAKQQAALELEAARLDLDSANARLATTATQVQSAEESLRALEAGYREGISPLTDVLASETALTQARLMRLSADYDVKIAEIDLIKALGRTDALIK